MKTHAHSRVTFKPYHQHQEMLLPPNLEDLIPEKHLVRTVSKIIDQMDIRFLITDYKGGGTSSYHPKMMLKVLMFAYSQKLYSSRQIGKALRENINFMWLSGQTTPDFRTINRFRSSRLKGTIEEVFYLVVDQLSEAGLIELKSYFLDGTKMEADANKYSYVWSKNTARYQARIREKIKELLQKIDSCNDHENELYGDKDLPELGEGTHISSEKIKEIAQKINERLKPHPEDTELKTAGKKLISDYLPKQEKYEKQERLLNGRNSYSKTDPDATFMRMKEDHLGTGQLKAAYNVQMGTENQFILGYSIHQNAGDSPLLKPHLDMLKSRLGMIPENVVADGGYGSEENYEYLDDEAVTAYVKYNYFHIEKTQKVKENPFHASNMFYDTSTDSYECPNGRKLKYVEEKPFVTLNRYSSSHRIYECEDCSDCELRSHCHKSSRNRRIEISPKLQKYRNRARDLLNSDVGKRYRTNRSVEVESVFGQLKHNGQFRRFMLRGLEKVNIEFGLIAAAHNMKKLHKKLMN